MGSFSDYLESKLLDHVLGNTAYVAPSTVYLALYTALPGDVSASGTEVTGGSYARVAVLNNTTNWSNSTGTSPTTKVNGATFTFPTATANWGLIVGFAIYDSGSGGNELLWAALTTSKNVNSGDTARFNSGGAITITLD